MTELVEGVKAHAREHYSTGGWDVVVECYTDDEIREVLTEENASTVGEAIEAFRFRVDVWADRQADTRNSAF
ncbi:hypothetical protein [Saccharopolyspora hattusasensis]|uniref:hypothetical protein n=1 Tax=Saccharopolyspora hattusasensis TaxID=1128679 RepID=UPI003D990E71